jgi:hypothetical protein
MNGIVGIAVVVEFNKSITIFHHDFAKSAVSLEKLFQVPLAGIARDVPYVHALTTRHVV